VLRPDAPQSVLTGGDGGGELGRFHAGRDRVAVVDAAVPPLALDPASTYVLADIVLPTGLEVTQGTLRLARAAVSELCLDPAPTSPAAERALIAESSVLGRVAVLAGAAQLEYCTVIGEIGVDELYASDCVFAGAVRAAPGACDGTPSSPPPAVDAPAAGCIRYSRVPSELSALVDASATSLGLPHGTITHASPVFWSTDFAADLSSPAPCASVVGVGVLHPATPEAVRAGAEDGGELGAYHEEHHCLGRAAVEEKLRGNLPAGIEAVLIPDERLLFLPPKTDSSPS
jgi:hypothetical protein